MCFITKFIQSVHRKNIQRSRRYGRCECWGHSINNLRYADDTSLLALKEQKLQNLLTTVNDKGKLYGMEINLKKTKSMVASKKQETPEVSINLDGTAIEQVEKLVYLGSITTEDVKSEVEIKRRIEIARNAFNHKKSVLS